jgi:hypothetical protein
VAPARHEERVRHPRRVEAHAAAADADDPSDEVEGVGGDRAPGLGEDARRGKPAGRLAPDLVGDAPRLFPAAGAPRGGLQDGRKSAADVEDPDGRAAVRERLRRAPRPRAPPR